MPAQLPVASIISNQGVRCSSRWRLQEASLVVELVEPQFQLALDRLRRLPPVGRGVT